MLNRNTDREWEKIGKTDPYFGVLTQKKFHSKNITDEKKHEFFASGFNYIDDVLNKIRQHIDENFTINKALDFGCGVGRLAIPLANIAQEVTGVDISDSMLIEAKKNCELQKVKNIIFLKSDDTLLSSLNGHYNFIHSFIVFQHIPVKRGEMLFKNLIQHLESDGICVVHFKYNKTLNLKNFFSFLMRYVPLSKNFIKKLFAPQMQMNAYNLNRLFLVIQKAGILNCYMDFTNHGGVFGVVIYFKKP